MPVSRPWCEYSNRDDRLTARRLVLRMCSCSAFSLALHAQRLRLQERTDNEGHILSNLIAHLLEAATA